MYVRVNSQGVYMSGDAYLYLSKPPLVDLVFNGMDMLILPGRGLAGRVHDKYQDKIWFFTSLLTHFVHKGRYELSPEYLGGRKLCRAKKCTIEYHKGYVRYDADSVRKKRRR